MIQHKQVCTITVAIAYVQYMYKNPNIIIPPCSANTAQSHMYSWDIRGRGPNLNIQQGGGGGAAEFSNGAIS